MKNALSIDFEDCLCNEFLLEHIPKDFNKNIIEDQVLEATDRILKLLNKYDTKVTFFVLGRLAEKYPDYIKMLHENGHEIGSHTYSHTTLYKLGRQNFEEEINLSTAIIKSITGEQPLGFRAPSFSLNQSTIWAMEVIEKHGYLYDSSIFPIRMLLYGVPNAPITPYRPSKNDITKNDPDGKIIEFPLSIIKFITNVPISGGFYLRTHPKWFLKYSINNITRDRPANIYIHPWETYPDTPRLRLPLHSRFEAYHGIGSSYNKLEMLLEKHEFAPLRDVLNI